MSISIDNKPEVNGYDCTSCYKDWTWTAGDLRVYENECWCKPCWDERRWKFPDLPSWNDLEPYTPELQDECEKLRKNLETEQPAADQFIATFRCENNGIVGTTNAKIHSVTRHDDGRIEVVIDYWPEQPAPDRCPHGVRLPHECKECADTVPASEALNWAEREFAAARQSPGEPGPEQPAPDVKGDRLFCDLKLMRKRKRK